MFRLIDETIKAATDGDLGIDDVMDTEAMLAPTREALVAIYADALSEDELASMIAFRSSDIGRSIAAKQPHIETRAKTVFADIVGRFSR